MPALFTSKSIARPFRASTRIWIESSLVTSSAWSCRFAPCCFTSSPKPLDSSGFRAVATTCQSSAAYCRVNSSPIPRLAPVTNTVAINTSAKNRFHSILPYVGCGTGYLVVLAERNILLRWIAVENDRKICGNSVATCAWRKFVSHQEVKCAAFSDLLTVRHFHHSHKFHSSSRGLRSFPHLHSGHH